MSATSEDMEMVEREFGINVDVSDASGCTHVYTYTKDGERVGFDFNTMNPDLGDLRTAAQAIAMLKSLCNKRPRVGVVTAS